MFESEFQIGNSGFDLHISCILWHLNISFLARSNRHWICRQLEILVYNRKFVIPKGFCGLKTGWWRAEHAARTMCTTLPTGMYVVIYPVVGGGVDLERDFRHSSCEPRPIRRPASRYSYPRSPPTSSPRGRRGRRASLALGDIGEVKLGEFRAPEAAAQEQRKQDTVAFALEGRGIGGPQQLQVRPPRPPKIAPQGPTSSPSRSQGASWRSWRTPR